LSLNWDEIALGRRELSHLDVVFSEEEVEAVVQELASDKAPRPHGFIAIFLKKSCNLRKGDILHAVDFFGSQH
jgi:hypothetical protein